MNTMLMATYIPKQQEIPARLITDIYPYGSFDHKEHIQTNTNKVIMRYMPYSYTGMLEVRLRLNGGKYEVFIPHISVILGEGGTSVPTTKDNIKYTVRITNYNVIKVYANKNPIMFKDASKELQVSYASPYYIGKVSIPNNPMNLNTYKNYIPKVELGDIYYHQTGGEFLKNEAHIKAGTSATAVLFKDTYDKNQALKGITIAGWTQQTNPLVEYPDPALNQNILSNRTIQYMKIPLDMSKFVKLPSQTEYSFVLELKATVGWYDENSMLTGNKANLTNTNEIHGYALVIDSKIYASMIPYTTKWEKKDFDTNIEHTQHSMLGLAMKVDKDGHSLLIVDEHIRSLESLEIIAHSDYDGGGELNICNILGNDEILSAYQKDLE
jgi:hypothetical protein